MKSEYCEDVEMVMRLWRYGGWIVVQHLVWRALYATCFTCTLWLTDWQTEQVRASLCGWGCMTSLAASIGYLYSVWSTDQSHDRQLRPDKRSAICTDRLLIRCATRWRQCQLMNNLARDKNIAIRADAALLTSSMPCRGSARHTPPLYE